VNRTCRVKTSNASTARDPHSRGTVRCVLAIGMAVLLLGLGCGKGGPSRNPIGGKVQLDGKPLQKGSILFSPIKGTKGPVTGGEIENGQYQLPKAIGPMEGRHRVEITSPRKTGRQVPAPLGPAGQMVDEYGEAIPSRFNSESTLEVEIKPGANAADFDVVSR
jgi:hypothetical protein